MKLPLTLQKVLAEEEYQGESEYDRVLDKMKKYKEPVGLEKFIESLI